MQRVARVEDEIRKVENGKADVSTVPVKDEKLQPAKGNSKKVDVIKPAVKDEKPEKVDISKEDEATKKPKSEESKEPAAATESLQKKKKRKPKKNKKTETTTTPGDDDFDMLDQLIKENYNDSGFWESD